MSAVEPTDTAVARPKPLAIEVVIASILFGLLGSGFLSIYYVGLFVETSPGAWYPFGFPAWSYGITILKMAGMVVWLVLSRRLCRWPAGILAGVFLIGGLHALACGICNREFEGESAFYAVSVQLAYLCGATYLLNFVFVVRRVIASNARPLPGFLLGLLIGAGLPALAQLAAWYP